MSCLSRKDVGKHIFWSVINTYSNIRSTSIGMCMMKGNHLPYDVIIKNSEQGRDLEDPEGYKKAGWVSSGDKLRKKLRGPTDKGKENMGKREPRAVEETFLGLRLRRQKLRLRKNNSPV